MSYLCPVHALGGTRGTVYAPRPYYLCLYLYCIYVPRAPSTPRLCLGYKAIQKNAA